MSSDHKPQVKFLMNSPNTPTTPIPSDQIPRFLTVAKKKRHDGWKNRSLHIHPGTINTYGFGVDISCWNFWTALLEDHRGFLWFTKEKLCPRLCQHSNGRMEGFKIKQLKNSFQKCPLCSFLTIFVNQTIWKYTTWICFWFSWVKNTSCSSPLIWVDFLRPKSRNSDGRWHPGNHQSFDQASIGIHRQGYLSIARKKTYSPPLC